MKKNLFLIIMLVFLAAPAFAQPAFRVCDKTGDCLNINSNGTVPTSGGAAVAGSNTEIQYNNSGALGAEAAFTYDSTTNTQSVDKIISPLIIGGTATTSDLTLKTTSGVGTTGADTHFLVGNNGATEALTILNNGFIGINDSSPSYSLDITPAALVIPDATTSYFAFMGGSSSSVANNTGSSRGFYLNPHYTGTSNMGTFSSIYAISENDATAGTIADNYSIIGRAFNNSTGTVTGLAGMYADAKNVGAGTVTNAYGFYQAPIISSGAGGTITNVYGLFINKPSSGSGTITNAYGISIPAFESSSVATNNSIGMTIGGAPSGPIEAALYTASGDIRFNTGKIIHSYTTVNNSSGVDSGQSIIMTRNNSNTGTTGELQAYIGTVTALDASGTVAGVVGSDITATNGNTNTTTTLSGYEATIRNTAAGTTTNGYGFRLNNLVNSTGTFTNTYGIYLGDVTAGTQTNTPYGIYQQDTGAINYFGGKLGIGDTNPSEALDLAGNMVLTGTIVSTKTTDIGWSVQAAANQACNTTCTSACVVGFDTGLGGDDLLDCTSALSDRCLCAGPN